MDTINIEKIINDTENDTIEFKQNLSGTKSFIKDICAFANTNGGFIIIGIDDKTKKITGISKDDIFQLEEKVANIIADNFDNRPSYIVRTKNIKGKLLLCFKIYPGEFVPYFIKKQGKKEGTYVRLGSTSRPASQEEIKELERRKENISFDATEVIQAHKNNLDYPLIEKTLEQIAAKNDLVHPGVSDKLLESLKIIKKSGNNYTPTVGGLLLFGYKDKIEQYLPQAKVKCARFKGNLPVEYLDKKEFSGSLINQVENTIKFYKLNEQKYAQINDLYREEDYIIPLTAIREAVVNAIVHRNYSISGADIKFNIFDDYIEIISPGKLPFGITKQDLGQGISEVRNKVIARMFLKLALIEQWGQGIVKIIELTTQKGLKKPSFEERSNFFKVTLYKQKQELLPESPPATTSINNKNSINEKLSTMHFRKYSLDEIQKIISFVQENKAIGNLDCQKLLNLEDYQAKHLLKRLAQKGILKEKGQRKSRKYYLTKD